MILIGLIKNEDPTSLIDPLNLESVEAVYEYLSLVLKKRNFVLSTPLTIETLTESFKLEKPLLINFGERSVSLMMGEEHVIMASTSRFIHVGLLQELADL
ncbi:hypothetical protein [Dyadobacter chenhuakuii]|uniref:Uncharacterized protein n=1 Tax=Dyadobacter chenhuakuii TaxID=2909339 RepID=A0A9X1QH06_9BACT|nr:hypothetical protein [Dyadobacter chenhuakuii]MCF2501376.1 hypothetical protein [Dyadobacter chenhuakuii]